MQIVIEGDRHTKLKEPYFSALSDYTDWILQQEWNNPDTYFISLGDLFDTSSPTPSEYRLIIRFIEESKFKKIIILAGNHDYNRAKEQYSLFPLEEFSKVEVVYREKSMVLGNKSFLLLPYFYPNLYEGVSSIEEHYSELHHLPIGQEKYDYILGHVYLADTYGSFCDLSNLNGYRIAGHDHIARTVGEEGEYIGVPVPTRYSDRGQNHNLIKITEKGKEYLPIPQFLDYKDVHYPEPYSGEQDGTHLIFDIHNAQSKESALSFYKEQIDPLYVREIFFKKNEGATKDDGTIRDDSDLASIEEYFEEFCVETGKSDELKNVVLPLIS